MFMMPIGWEPPRGRPVKYPIGILNIGESMFLAGATYRQINNSTRIHRPKIFSIRTVVEDGVKGVRVYRVAERTHHRPTGRPPKFPLRSMEVGDSIFCPGETSKSMWDRWRRVPGKSFKAKTVMLRGEIGARVWRIA